MDITDLLAPGQPTSVSQLPTENSGDHVVHPPAVAGPDSAVASSSQREPAKKTSLKRQRKTKSTSGKKRKQKTYLSTTQIAERDAHAAFESQVLNLTLDINDLQQLVRLLEERRSLHVTRLMVTRQEFENDVYHVMERYMRVFGLLSRRRTSHELTEFLSRVDPCMLGPDMNAKGSLPFFMWQWGCYNNRFHHWQFNEISTRIVTFIEYDTVEDDNIVIHERNSTRPVCGPGGCVVETVGEFTGSPTRAMVAAMFPNLLSDEGHTASLTSQTMHFPTRMIVYFDSRGNIVKHVLEADAFAALHAIVEANAPGSTNISPNDRFTELPALPSAAAERTDEVLTGSGDTSGDENNYSGGERGCPASSTGSRFDVDYLMN